MTGKKDRPADDAEAELRSRLAAILESSSDAIISLTLNGIIASWNAGAEAMFGYSAREIIGRSISVLYPSDRAAELSPILDRVRLGRRVDRFETKRVHKDGTTIEVSLSVSPVRDGSGAVIGACGVARDVTERRWAEAKSEAAEAGQRQSERMEIAVRLAGAIAGEFSSLLSGIMGFAASVAAATTADQRVHADVQQIQAGAGRAARLARDLLLFSRREPTRPERVDLNAVLARSRNLLQASVGVDIDVRFIMAPYLPTVMADRGQMEQVLLNLAVNARDAMPRGGILTFTTGTADLSEVPGVVWPKARPGRCAVLTVSDTGCGMDAAAMPYAFEPFFSTKPPSEGTGLGLAAVYGIVTKAGGGITIDSEKGMGTSVHIYLPAGYVPTQASARKSPGEGRTILVVDDEPAALEVTARILRHSGYRTFEAGSCAEALSLLSAHDPDLLLTDNVMPEMPGQALPDQAREIKPGLRIVQMSGSPLGPDRLANPEIPVIGKPFTAKHLLETVEAVLTANPAR
jgi:PAS domain S-box-containing protein